MHINNVLILYINCIICSLKGPTQISLPSSIQNNFPYLVYYNNKRFLFTSIGVYTLFENDMTLSPAYPEFPQNLNNDKLSSEYYQITFEDKTSIVIFPYISNSIFYKTYKKSTNYYNSIQWSYDNSILSPIQTSQYNDKIIISFVNKSGYGMMLILNSQKEIEIELTTDFLINDSMFSCRYFIFIQKIACVYGDTVNQIMKYVIYEEDRGFGELTILGTIKQGYIPSGVKIEDNTTIKAIGSVIENTKDVVTLFHFTMNQNKFHISDSLRTAVSTSNYFNYFFYFVLNKYIFLAGSNGYGYKCRFYQNSDLFISLSIEGKDSCFGNQGFNLHVTFFNNILGFAYMKRNDKTHVYIYEHRIMACTDYEFTIDTNSSLYFTRSEMVDIDQFDIEDDKSGIFLYKAQTNTLSQTGTFYEIDNDNNIIGEVTLSHSDYFYKRIKYVPKYVQNEEYLYIIFYYVEDSFYISSSYCKLNINAQCYESCETCSNEIGNEENHQCRTCKEGFFFKDNSNNCYQGNVPFLFFNSQIKKYKNCLSHCYSCNDDTSCNICQEGYKKANEYDENENSFCVNQCNSSYYFDIDNNFVCLPKKQICPPKFACMNKETKHCYPINANNLNLCSIVFPNTNNITMINSYLDENVIAMYKGEIEYHSDLYSVFVHSSNDTSHDSNYTEIYLQQCENKIRNENEIGDSFLIGHIEFTDNNDVYYSFYKEDGNKINFTCENETIELFSHIKEEDLSIEPTMIKLFHKEKIDLFNVNDSFFNDECFAFSDETERDIIIADRRTKYYQNLTIKKENCLYKETNTDTMKTTFECTVKNNNNIVSFTGTSYDTFPSSSTDSTYNIVLCLEQITKINFFSKNFGNYILMSIFISQNAFFLVYLCYLKSIFIQHWTEEENEDVISPSNEMTKSTETNVIIYSKPHVLNIPVNRMRSFSDKTVSNYTNSNKSKISLNFDALDFNEAVMFDKRNFCTIFISRIKMFSAIYTIVSNKTNKIKYITISTSIYYITLCLFFNSLFYSKKYISHIYYNGYEFGFEIWKYLLSSITSVGIKMFIEIVIIKNFPAKGELNEDAIKNQFHKEEYVRSMKRCNCVLFFIIIVSTAFYWYYVSVFCTVYHHTQWYWIYGSMFSIAINIVLSFMASFLCVILRIFSLKCNNEFLFHLVKIIEIC